jgi:hypothetical protein
MCECYMQRAKAACRTHTQLAARHVLHNIASGGECDRCGLVLRAELGSGSYAMARFWRVACVCSA